MKKITLSVSGDRGSFSEEAGRSYAERIGAEPELSFAIDMEGVLSELDSGTCEFGIFPVVNSTGGLVRSAFDAMGRHSFTVIDEVPFDVHQCLMALHGTDIIHITHIVSHPQGLAQCKQYLAKNFEGILLVEWEDTAKAAKDLSEGKLPKTSAVVAPAASAALYNLTLLAKDIQDVNPNITTF